MATTLETPNYNVDYEDERFQQVEAEKQNALTSVNNTYNNMLNQSEQYFNEQIEATKQWEEKQTQLQQENTEFAIEQIEQQKAQANKEYQKEQSGAYVDWQKESNKYGANAETMAANGLQGTGFSESSQVSMYNQYQSRVAAARESYNQITLNYNNAIKEAQLANSSALAEIAFDSLRQQLELSLQGFQYQNQLLTEQLAQQQATEERYYGRYQDVLAQLNQENALAEQVRQYNQNYLLQQEQMLQEQENWQKEYEMLQEQNRQEQLNWEKEYALQEAAANGPILGTGNELQGLALNHPLWDAAVTGNTTAYESLGNSKSTYDKDDYYFSNGYQPRYINNTKLEESGMKTDILPSDSPIPAGQNIWKAGDQYYAWYGEGREYVNVTEQVTFSNGYQPKYIEGKELKSAGTIKDTIGSYGNLSTSQNVWRAGEKFYVWNGKKKSYEDVTKQYKEYTNKRGKKLADFMNSVTVGMYD